MKNRWIHLKRQKQFKQIEDYLGKTYFPITGVVAQFFCDIPEYKLIVKASGNYICTIWLRPKWNDARECVGDWWLGFYENDKEHYLRAELPEFNNSMFWISLSSKVEKSVAVYKKPKTETASP